MDRNKIIGSFPAQLQYTKRKGLGHHVSTLRLKKKKKFLPGNILQFLRKINSFADQTEFTTVFIYNILGTLECLQAV